MITNNVLDERILDILNEYGINSLTTPQLKSIPLILKNKHCLILAPTGMGKTEAALLPVFNQFIQQKFEGISILYITPLRALNRDMFRRTFSWGKKLGIKIAVRHGDTSQYERRKQAISPPDMLITTPETLQILLVGKRLRQALKNVRWVIIDEIHELAEDERGAQLTVALERLQELSNTYQRIGLSATVSNPDDIAKFMGGKQPVSIIKPSDTKEMEINVEMPTVSQADKESAAKLNIDDKQAALLRRIKELIESHKATLFFVNTRDAAEILAARLKESGLEIGIHHGSLSKEARIEAEETFKQGLIKALICTSSLELGLDIGQVDFVLQYNSPRQVTRLIQRVGRSGHKKDKKSKGTILALNSEEYAESLVIVEKTLSFEIEPIAIRKNPLTVLANQIILMVKETNTLHIQKAYEIITRAYPFFELPKQTYLDVITLLQERGLVWIEDDTISRRRKSTSYFIDNISMIPDEKNYDVVDMASNKTIGVLDESFVSNFCEIGNRFIIKGKAWEIAKIQDKIYVSPARQTYVVPDWAGEEIPVTYDIASAVGEKRRKAYEGITQDIAIQKEISCQRKAGFVVPNDKIITIEKDKKIVYINTHFGTKVNHTLSKIIGSLLAQRIGESVSMGSDAYRIYFTLPRSVTPQLFKDIILNIKPESIGALLRIILKKSAFIKWEIVKVARKFGLLEKTAEIDKFAIERLINIFSTTPFIDEVIDYAIWTKMDINTTKKVMQSILAGGISLVIQPLSPMSLLGENLRKEFLKPFGVDASTLAALKKRLGETKITLICVNCKHSLQTKVYRATLSCPKCSSTMLAVCKRNEQPSLNWLMKNASLVSEYGKNALYVLAAYGVGPDTAARILAQQKKGDSLLKEILKAEITYARTKQFWD